MNTEDALIELLKARDGDGRAVLLHCGEITADALRESTRIMAGNILPAGTAFLSHGKDGGLCVSTQAEASAWENLALLCRATAAAIREGL